MPKRDITLSFSETLDFLARHSECLLAWNDGHAAPAVVLASFQLDDQALHVRVDAGRDLLRDLAADARVVVIVEQSPTYYEIAHVTVRGSADRVAGVADGGVTFRLVLDDVSTSSFAKLLEPEAR